MTEFVLALWEMASTHIGKELATLFLTIGGSAIVWPFLTYLWAKLLHAKEFWNSRRRALGAVSRINTGEGWREGNGIWALQPICQPENYKANVRASRILAVANLKGGVGKTTIAANIAAHLASDRNWNKRVLLVDLDYQGSLSSMAFPNDLSWLPPRGADSAATLALSGEITPGAFLHACKEVEGEPKLRIATAYYDVAQADNRLLVEWLLNKRSKDRRNLRRKLADLLAGRAFHPNEMRYNLAKLLHSEAVRENFDLIIIDCPPRLTAGTIQALCASSHLLIPTLLDGPSGESVVSFCEQVEALKAARLCPHIEYVGIVASRYAAQQVAWHPAMRFVDDQLKAKKIACGFLPKEAYVPQTNAIGQQSAGIAYYDLKGSQAAANARQAFATLAEHVAAQVCVSRTPAFERNLQLVLPVAAE